MLNWANYVKHFSSHMRTHVSFKLFILLIPLVTSLLRNLITPYGNPFVLCNFLLNSSASIHYPIKKLPSSLWHPFICFVICIFLLPCDAQLVSFCAPCLGRHLIPAHWCIFWQMRSLVGQTLIPVHWCSILWWMFWSLPRQTLITAHWCILWWMLCSLPQQTLETTPPLVQTGLSFAHWSAWCVLYWNQVAAMNESLLQPNLSITHWYKCSSPHSSAALLTA